MRLWERIHKDSWGFLRICKTLGEDFQQIHKDLQDFGRGFVRIRETLGRFVRLWERICEDLQGFGRGFMRICETLGEDL